MHASLASEQIELVAARVLKVTWGEGIINLFFQCIARPLVSSNIYVQQHYLSTSDCELAERGWGVMDGVKRKVCEECGPGRSKQRIN